MTFAVEALAVKHIEEIGAERYQHNQEGVENELVDGSLIQEEDYEELERSLYYGGVGVDFHLLASGYGRFVGDGQQAGDEGDDAELVDPAGGAHTLDGNHELRIQKPQAKCLADY